MVAVAIECYGRRYRASVCKHCGMRMWPSREMRNHQQRHKDRQREEAQLKEETRRNWTAIKIYWDRY